MHAFCFFSFHDSMAYRRSLGQSSDWTNGTSSQTFQPPHLLPSSGGPRALIDPRLLTYREGSTSRSSLSTTSSGALIPPRFPNTNPQHRPAVLSSSLPSQPPSQPVHVGGPVLGGNSSVAQNPFPNHQSSVRPLRSSLPVPTRGYTGLAMHPPPQPLLPAQQSSSFSPLVPPPHIIPPPPPSQWFNPSHATFPPFHIPPPLATPRLQASDNTFVNAVAPPCSSSPLLFPCPSPSPYLRPPHFPSNLTRMPPPTGHGPRFIAPHQQMGQFPSSFDISQQVLPGFKPAPAPVGIEEKLGLSKVKGQQKVKGQLGESGSRLAHHLPSGSDVSDPFISNWLKRVEGSYLGHQQQKELLKRHSMKVGMHAYV